MNALVAKPPEQMPISYNEIERLAADMAQSGLFGFKTKAQAMTIMMISLAEGRHPALAARDYDIINGKPAKKAEAMMRDFVQAGGKMKWHSLTDDKADATFTHPQTGDVRIEWDMKRAAMAQLAGKENWKKYPRQMLRNRVVSEGIRTLWPLATSGLYVPDEVADFTGTTIDHEAEPEQPDARDAINEEVPNQRAAAAATPRPPSRSEEPPRARTDEQWEVWTRKLDAACAVLRTEQEIAEVGARGSVKDAIAPTSESPDWVKRDATAILSKHYKRIVKPQEGQEDELPEIVGEEKLAAG